MILPGQLLLYPLHPTLIYDGQISELKENNYKKKPAVVLITGLFIYYCSYYHSHSQTQAQSQFSPRIIIIICLCMCVPLCICCS